MSRFIRSILMIVLGLCFVAGDLHAQRTDGVNSRSAQRIGLTPVWSKTIPTGYGGKVTGVTIFASPSRGYRATDVVDKYGRRTFFSDRDLHLGVSQSGYNQQTRLTNLATARLEALDLDPVVESQSISDVTIYVSSSLGTVAAFDAETGEEKWSTKVGKRGYTNPAVAASDAHVVAIHGSTIYLMDAASGQVLDSVPSRKMPGNIPTISGNSVYVPQTNGVVDVLSLDDLRRVEFTLGSAGRITTPVSLSEKSISWTTDQGYMYVANVGQPGVKYRFQSLDTIASASASMDGKLYATSVDGFAYAMQESNGKVAWRYSAGGPIRHDPVAVDGRVFVSTVDGKLSCLDGETGDVNWRSTNFDRFVTASQTRLYYTTKDHRLAVHDIETGNELGNAPLGSLSFPVVNTTTDRVYLINSSGKLICLREPNRRWPLVRKSSVGAATPDAKSIEPEATNAAEPTDDGDDSVPSADAPITDPFEDDTFGVDEADMGDVGGDDLSDDPADDFSDPFGSDDEDMGDDESDPFGEPF